MLTRNHRQEALSRAYVQIIAARCGLTCSVRDFDYGIDLTLHDIMRRGRRYVESGLLLNIQAKSTAAATRTTTDVLYDMDVKTFDDLRDTTVGKPRILVLLVLPNDESQWTVETEEHLLLRHCAYWMSLRGQRAIPNKRTVRVAIPRTNVFSVEGLQGLMERLREGQEL